MFSQVFHLSLYTLITLVSCAFSARILLLCGPGEGSHYITATAIGEALVKRGHDVTILLSDLYAHRANATKDSQKYNYEIHVYRSSMTAEERDEFYGAMNRAAFKGQFIHFIIANISKSNEFAYAECENILTDERLLSRLNSADFDLVLVDMIYNCPLLVAQYLDKPFIYFAASSVIPHAFAFRYRLPINTAYIPELLTGLDHRLSFTDRMKNTLNTAFGIMLNGLILSPYDKLKSEYQIKPDMSMYDTLAEAELWFVHTNYALDFPRPLMPNVIPVGGLTSRPAKSLTNELREFIESSGDDGVILFSMGTYVMSMDDDVASMFAKAFQSLPQKIIWKLGGSLPKDLSDNVKIMKWIPQNDILGHKSVRAFVMHCGINGVYEALYHAVPLICLPLFGDQFDIAARVASKGIGIQLDVATLQSDVLAKSIRTLIADKQFEQNMLTYSQIFRDAPQHPAEVGADWMEYVIRHKGARHLRSPALDLPTYQYLLIDVLATVCVCLMVALFISISICKFCRRKCCKRRDKSKTE